MENKIRKHRFEDLILWQKAHQLNLEIYALTAAFPREELYSLTNQLRRACTSVPNNIVESLKKRTTRNKINSLSIAENELEEVKYLTLLSRDLKYLSLEQYESIFDKLEEVGKLLNGFIKSVETNS